MSDKRPYGQEDASYQAAGGFEGLQSLARAFYQAMEQRSDAQVLRTLYPEDLTLAQDKLASFLSGWLGGPRLFAQKYGSISLPSFHAQWDIDQGLSQAWLNCMGQSIAEQHFAPDFAEYLMNAFSVPAQRIRQASHNRHHAQQPEQ